MARDEKWHEWKPVVAIVIKNEESIVDKTFSEKRGLLKVFCNVLYIFNVEGAFFQWQFDFIVKVKVSQFFTMLNLISGLQSEIAQNLTGDAHMRKGFLKGKVWTVSGIEIKISDILREIWYF